MTATSLTLAQGDRFAMTCLHSQAVGSPHHMGAPPGPSHFPTPKRSTTMTTTPVSPNPPHRPRVLHSQRPKPRHRSQGGWADLGEWARECLRCLPALAAVLALTALGAAALWLIVSVFALFPHTLWGW